MASGAPLAAMTKRSRGSVPAGAPHVGEREELGRERVLAHQRPARRAGARCPRASRRRGRGRPSPSGRRDRAGWRGCRTRRARGTPRAAPRPRGGDVERARRPRGGRGRPCGSAVSVPVLSVQTTVAEPSASTAATRRVSTLRREMRQAPSARKTVSTTGNSSGSMAIARVIPASRPRAHSPRREAPDEHQHHAEPEADDRDDPHDAGRPPAPAGSAPPGPPRRLAPIVPIAVRAPVRCTSATPRPRTTSVPENTKGESSPPGAPAVGAPRSPCAGGGACAPGRTRR